MFEMARVNHRVEAARVESSGICLVVEARGALPSHAVPGVDSFHSLGLHLSVRHPRHRRGRCEIQILV